MGRYLSRWVVQLLKTYLKICCTFGFVVFTYDRDKNTFETAKWRKIVSSLFGLIYLPVFVMTAIRAIVKPFGCHSAAICAFYLTVYFHLMYLVLLQCSRPNEFVVLLNSFLRILQRVHSVTHRKIVFTKVFALRSAVGFMPIVLLFLFLVLVFPQSVRGSYLIATGVLPKMLVDILHHSVYIALCIVSKMYENLNSVCRQTDDCERLLKVYLKLFRFSKKFNKLLSGYFSLHFFVDLSTLLVLMAMMSLKCKTPLSIFFPAASAFNKMYSLMAMADEINERSKFYHEVTDCRPESQIIRINFRLYSACKQRIDKRMFLKIIATVTLILVLTNRLNGIAQMRTETPNMKKYS